MKTKLQKELAKIAPSICIRTLWEHDTDHDISIFGEGWTLHGENPEDWQQWQSEIRASAIVEGEEITGSAYLGGTWEKAGDLPEESNPTISGCELQMTVEALDELRAAIPADVPLEHHLYAEIDNALSHCQQEMEREYAEQRAAIEEEAVRAHKEQVMRDTLHKANVAFFGSTSLTPA